MKRKAKLSEKELMMKVIRGDASEREDNVLIIENQSKQSTGEEQNVYLRKWKL